MPHKEHTHSLRKVSGTKILQYICNDPDCSYTVLGRLAKGKRWRCPYCTDTYILNARQMRLGLPHCKNCTKGQYGKEVSVEISREMPNDILEDFLKDALL